MEEKIKVAQELYILVKNESEELEKFKVFVKAKAEKKEDYIFFQDSRSEMQRKEKILLLLEKLKDLYS